MSTTPSGGLMQRLLRIIDRQGPLSVADYMTLCLLDPRDGYYTRGEGLGREGDFLTAPEMGQLFGEMLAAWMIQAWMEAGRPSPLRLRELGPGRGLLMSDVLRVLVRQREMLSAVASIDLVDPSPSLRAAQRRTLAPFLAIGVPLRWQETMIAPDATDVGPVYVIGNEVLDALPVHQLMALPESAGWAERRIGTLPGNPGLAWVCDRQPSPLGVLVHGEDRTAGQAGAVTEVSPARMAMVDHVAREIQTQGGLALFVDYGLAEDHRGPTGPTVQAIRAHRRVDPLEAPGLADLTALVDFRPLQRIVAESGLTGGRLLDQGPFLEACGVEARVRHLAQTLDSVARERLVRQHYRLVAPDQMGRLFKLFAFARHDQPLPMVSSAEPSGREPNDRG